MKARGYSLAVRIACLFLLFQGAGAWHAFTDRRVAPDIPGTSLHPDLVPYTYGMADMQKASLTYKCAIAFDSAEKAAKVCTAFHGSCKTQCSGTCLACAASLNSAVRDAYDMIDINCNEVEERLSAVLNASTMLLGQLPKNILTVDKVFSESDFNVIQDWCKDVVRRWLPPCSSRFEKYCSPYMAPNGVDGANSSVSLAPSIDECSNFVVTQSGTEYSFLTWGLLRRYTREDLGCSGGLKLLTEVEEYKSWSCVHQPDCTLYAKDDMACFKYNEMRGEFHFWGWNSQLNLHPALFQVKYSLCEAGIFRWTRASTGLPIHLNNSGKELPATLRIRIKNDESVPGDTIHDFQPIYANLGRDGCGTFDLRQNTDYWIDASLGDDYYAWNGWFTSGAASIGLPTQTLDLTFVDKPSYNAKSCTLGTAPDDWMLRFTLKWCIQEQINLDMYLVGEAGGLEQVSRQNLEISDKDVKDPPTYKGLLERSDNGLAQSTMARSFGPETIYVKGRLPAGQWRLLVNVYPTLRDGQEDAISPNEDYKFLSQCASVNFFASMKDTPVASVKMKSPGSSPGEATDWWHVLTVEVTDDGTVSWQTVDKFVSGPDPRTDNWRPVTPNPRHLFNADKLAVVNPDGQSCQLFYTIGLLARDATSLEFVAGFFSVDCPPENCDGAACCSEARLSLQDAVQVYDPILGTVKGGVQLKQSTEAGKKYRVDVVSDGFATSIFYFVLNQDRKFSKDVYMIPAEGGNSFVVLNWGNKPRDLNTYLFPLRIRNVDPAYSPSAVLGLDEVSPDPEGYLTWHRNPDVDVPGATFPVLPYRDRYGIPSKRSHVSFKNRRLQWNKKESGGAYVRPKFPCVGTSGTCISLARDDSEHGLLIDGFVNNGPEILSLTHLKEGNYRYFVNVYPGPWNDQLDSPELNANNGEFVDPVNIDIWMGNSMSSVILETSIIWGTPGGTWLYVGYFQVIDSEPGDNCDRGVSQQGLDEGKCILWHTVNEIAKVDPVSFNNFEVRLRFVTTPADFAEDLHTVSWVVYRGGSCTCLGSKVCTCEDGYIFDKGLLGRVEPLQMGQTTYMVNVNSFYLEEGMYWFVFSMIGYYDRAIQIHVAARDMRPEELDVVIMVQIAELAGARIVLNDGSVESAGHNMFLVSTNSARDRIIWEKQIASGLNSPLFSRSSASDELITFGFNTRGLSWAVAVHNPKYTLGTITRDMVSVEIYDSNGLVHVFSRTSVSEWWNVGFVQKLPTGFFVTRAATAGAENSCGAVFADTVVCSKNFYFEALDVSVPGGIAPSTNFTGFSFNRRDGPVGSTCSVELGQFSCSGSILAGEGFMLADGKTINKVDEGSLSTSSDKFVWSTVYASLYLVDLKKIIWLEFPAQRGYLTSLFEVNPMATPPQAIGDFVQRPCPSCMTIVLRWRNTVRDLDVHVFHSSKSNYGPSEFPVESNSSRQDPGRLYWGTALSYTKWGDVTLATQDNAYEGPESVVFGNASIDGTYQVVVNAYNNSSPDNVVPVVAVVTVYTVDGAKFRLSPPMEYTGGWYVGDIVKAGNQISWQTKGSQTNKLSISDLQKAVPFIETGGEAGNGSATGTGYGSPTGTGNFDP